jgi:hypothetical protein
MTSPKKPIRVMVEISSVKRQHRKINIDVIKSAAKTQIIAVRVVECARKPWPQAELYLAGAGSPRNFKGVMK